MNDIKQQAVDALNELHSSIDYSDYCTIMDGLLEIETLRERDRVLENLWDQFGDVPMNPVTECIEEEFMGWESGTHREDIWRWFDERHSKGVVHLLYRAGIDHYPELQKLFHRRACCFDCESETCAFNPNGVCMYPILYGKVPEYIDDVGCKGFLYKGD